MDDELHETFLALTGEGPGPSAQFDRLMNLESESDLSSIGA